MLFGALRSARVLKVGQVLQSSGNFLSNGPQEVFIWSNNG